MSPSRYFERNSDRCQWGRESIRPCRQPAVCDVTAPDGIISATCSRHMDKARTLKWTVATRAKKDPPELRIVERRGGFDAGSSPNSLCGASTMSTRRTSPEIIKSLAPGEIFVFGSNLDGRHGKGAALTAMRKFGAQYGVAEGLTGQTYALPTVGRRLSRMPLRDVEAHCRKFVRFAASRPDLTFLVTPVGCGLAGHKAKEIAPFFADAPENCILPQCFQP